MIQLLITNTDNVFKRGNRRLRGLGGRCQDHVTTAHSNQSLKIFPSDICTFLRPSTSLPAGTDITSIFVASIVSAASGSHPKRMIWLSHRQKGNIERTFVNNNSSLEVLSHVTILNIPEVL